MSSLRKLMICPACRLFPSHAQVLSVVVPPASATFFLYRRSSLTRGNFAVKSLHRQTVHEEQARKGAREASPKHLERAEAYV